MLPSGGCRSRDRRTLVVVERREGRREGSPRACEGRRNGSESRRMEGAEGEKRTLRPRLRYPPLLQRELERKEVVSKGFGEESGGEENALVPFFAASRCFILVP